MDELGEVWLTILIWGKTPTFVYIRERRVEVPHDDPFFDIVADNDYKNRILERFPFPFGVGGIQV